MVTIIFNEIFIINLLASGIRMSTPLMLTALGEIYAERSGVLNISLEGQMLIGALVGFIGAFYTHSLWIGLLLGAIGGLVFSLAFAFLSISLRASQVIVGIIMNLLSLGLTSFFYRVIFGRTFIPPHIQSMLPLEVPMLGQIPFLGPILFQQKSVVYLAFLFVPVASFVLYHTTVGLKVRAIGEYPLAAETLGVNVILTRYLCVILTGLTSGLAGAVISVTRLARFTDNMIAGRGFIALAIVIFSRWDPYRAMVAALFFGLVDSLQMSLQAVGVHVPSQFLLMLPYVATVFIMVVSRKYAPPAALAQPYVKEGD